MYLSYTFRVDVIAFNYLNNKMDLLKGKINEMNRFEFKQKNLIFTILYRKP